MIRTGYSIFLVIYRNLYRCSRAWHILSTCIDISACHHRWVIHQAFLSRTSCGIIYQAIMPVKSETRKLYTLFTIWQFYNSCEVAQLKSFVICKIHTYKISFVLLSISFHLSMLISFILQDSTNSVTSVVRRGVHILWSASNLSFGSFILLYTYESTVIQQKYPARITDRKKRSFCKWRQSKSSKSGQLA